MDSKADVLFKVCGALSDRNKNSATEILRDEYPFVPVERITRRYSVNQSMALFLRDRFTDRYTGKRLINPGVLRLLHVELGEDFPVHPHGKLSETHLAFWELFPTVDHVDPVSRGGADDESNWVTASMLSNKVKDQWTLDDLGWKLHSPSAVEWDGQSHWLVNYLAANPTVLAGAAESHRGYIRRWLTATKAALQKSTETAV
jgi:hypothetical protein